MMRGDVYWATLSPRSGAEQSGRRPIIILSHDAFNQTSAWRSIIIIPLSTSDKQARRGPTVVALSAGTGGLPGKSSAICHQVTTIDRAKLAEKIGALPLDVLKQVEQAVLASLDIQKIKTCR